MSVKFILGEKLGMTRMFDKAGNVIPVTVLRVGPIVVTQMKVKEKDGYTAAQVGFGTKRNISKARKGHLTTKGISGNIRLLKEFKLRRRKF